MLYIYCRAINVDSFAIVQEVFQRPKTAKEIELFYFDIPHSEANNIIPPDLLNETAAKNIQFYCQFKPTYLNFDPKSFRSSKDYTQSINITNCDLSLLNYNFLESFSALGNLYYFDVANLSSSLASLPCLPSLSKLNVKESLDFEGFDLFPVSNVPVLSILSILSCPKFMVMPNVPSLTKLTIDNCPMFNHWDVVAQLSQLVDVSLNRLSEKTITNALVAFTASPLIDKIVILNLTNNRLMKVPEQIQYFSQLRQVHLAYNAISEVNYGSLAFTSPYLEHLTFMWNELKSIEPSAFQGMLTLIYIFYSKFSEKCWNLGNLSISQIYLNYNSLTRFESSVFQPILEQMVAVDLYGGVSIWQSSLII